MIYGLKRATTNISNNAAKRLIPLGMHEFWGAELSNSGAQRHVADSITTLRLQLGVVLASVLGHCPHCNSINLHLRLRHS